MQTAMTLAELESAARVLGWQTGKPLRFVDPEGRILREIQPTPKAAG